MIIETDEGYIVVLAHLEFKPLVKNGYKVTPHTMIGIAGNTGRSDGYHLHMEAWDGAMKVGKNLRNPVFFFQKEITFYNQGTTTGGWSCRGVSKCNLCGKATDVDPRKQY